MKRFLVLSLMLTFVCHPLLLADDKKASPSPEPVFGIEAAGAEESGLMNEKEIDTLGIGKEIGLEEELEEDEFDKDDDAKSIGVEEVHN